MRYRCFCMTEDGRIITGAFVETGSGSEAVSAAYRLWRNVPGFHHPQVWLAEALLYPADAASPLQDRRGAAIDRPASFDNAGDTRAAAALSGLSAIPTLPVGYMSRPASRPARWPGQYIV